MLEVSFRFRGGGGVGIDSLNLFSDIWARAVNHHWVYMLCKNFFLNT